MENDRTARISSEQQDELEQRLRKAALDNRVPCASALAIAETMKIPPFEVGRTANKLKIKIKKCQLGCF